MQLDISERARSEKEAERGEVRRQPDEDGYHARKSLQLRRSRLERKVMYYYVYILQSKTEPERYYTGYTTNLESRLKKHNEGGCSHTSKYKPWAIKTAISFTEKEKALRFEKYLKSHSGRAFAVKHF